METKPFLSWSFGKQWPGCSFSQKGVCIHIRVMSGRLIQPNMELSLPGDIEAVRVLVYTRIIFPRPERWAVEARKAGLRGDLALFEVDYGVWMGTTAKGTSKYR